MGGRYLEKLRLKKFVVELNVECRANVPPLEKCSLWHKLPNQMKELFIFTRIEKMPSQ